MTQVERKGFENVKKSRGLTGTINAVENAECLDDNSSMATRRRRSGEVLHYFISARNILRRYALRAHGVRSRAKPRCATQLLLHPRQVKWRNYINSCRLAFAAHVKILSSRKRTQARSLAHSRLLANKVRPKTGLFDAIALRPWHGRNFIYPFIKKVASLLTRITYLDHDQLYCDLSRWDREQSLRLPRIDYTRSTCEAK